MTLAGACVADDGTLIVVGTLETARQAAVYLSAFDAAGMQLWDRLLYGSGGLYGAGIAVDGADGFIATCHGRSAKEDAALYLLTGDFSGTSVALQESDYRAAPGAMPLVMTDRGSIFTADSLGEVMVLTPGKDRATVEPIASATPGLTRSFGWDQGGATMYRSFVDDHRVWLELGGTLVAAPVSVDALMPHGFRMRKGASGSELVWIVRDGDARRWTVETSDLSSLAE